MGGVTGGNKGTMQDFPSLLLLFGCHLVVGEDDHHHDDDDDHDDDDKDDQWSLIMMTIQTWSII